MRSYITTGRIYSTTTSWSRDAQNWPRNSSPRAISSTLLTSRIDASKSIDFWTSKAINPYLILILILFSNRISLFLDVMADHSDKKSIMMYVMCYFQVLSKPKHMLIAAGNDFSTRNNLNEVRIKREFIETYKLLNQKLL